MSIPRTAAPRAATAGVDTPRHTRTRRALQVLTRSVASASVLLMAACGGPGEPATTATAQLGSCTVSAGPMAFLIGNRSNSPAVGADPQGVLAEGTQLAVENDSNMMLADTGGMPQVLTISSDDPSSTTPTETLSPGRRVANLHRAILHTQASAPEADPLEALNLAVDHIQAHGGSGTIVMVDSGLQTTGALDYTQPGLLSVPATTLAERLARSGKLPDLTGVTMVFVGLGTTARPQPKLNAASKDALKRHWLALARTAGAHCVTDAAAPEPGAAQAGLPGVSLVRVP